MAALDDLQCHFTWITEDNFQATDISKLLRDLDYKGEDGKPMNSTKQSFVAFLRTQVQDADLEKALEDVETAILVCQDPVWDEDACHRRGFELIALSNKAHIQHLLGDERAKEQTLEKILKLKAEDVSITGSKKTEETEDEESDAIDGIKGDTMTTQEKKNKIFQACNAGGHAYALQLLGLYPESLVLFREAERLDPEFCTWPMGRATAAGRQHRRLKEMAADPRILNDFDKEQEESLIRATKLSQDKNPVALSMLGDVYFYRGRGDLLNPQTQNKDLMEKAKKLYLESYELNPNSLQLLVRLAKVMLEIDRKRHERFAEECLMKAYDLFPENRMALHRIGQFYEHADSLKDLKKATEFYTKAVYCGPKRNVLAEMDLGRVRRKLDKNYDSVKHLRDMLEFYTSEEDQKIIKCRLEQMLKKNNT